MHPTHLEIYLIYRTVCKHVSSRIVEENKNELWDGSDVALS
jgi:hypothetical protein